MLFLRQIINATDTKTFLAIGPSWVCLHLNFTLGERPLDRVVCGLTNWFSNTSHCLNLKFKPITSQTRNAGIVDSTHNSKSDFELKSERSKSLRRTDLMLVHCSQNKRTLSGRPYAILRTGFARRRSKHKITIETLAGSATDNGRYLPN